MGYSFGAGPTDGPGTFTFRQGVKTENPLWDAVRQYLPPPTEYDLRCHDPKPILLATGLVRIVQVLRFNGVLFGILIARRMTILLGHFRRNLYLNI
jgi:hypothetical protein